MSTHPTFDTTQWASEAAQTVRDVYRGFLGRDPEPAGLAYWVGALAEHADIARLVEAISNSPECRQRRGHASAAARSALAVAELARSALAARPLSIVDVGARQLATEAHSYSAIVQHAVPHQIIGFEPVPEAATNSGQDAQGTRLRLLPNFIGDGQAHLFHINNDDATSSLLPFNRALTDDLLCLNELRTLRTETVCTSTLDAELADVAYVDFLKLDIQGFEMPALQNASATLERTNVIHCEVSFAEIYQGQSLFADIESYLREHGFYFLDFSSTCRYAYQGNAACPSRDRLGWADAVFFKQAQRLPGTQDLLAQMIIAMLVYRKTSLAAFLAKSHDRLAGSRLGELFLPV